MNISHAYMWVSGGKKCSFFGKFGVLCFLKIPFLKFDLLPYYRRFNLFQVNVPFPHPLKTSESPWSNQWLNHFNTIFHFTTLFKKVRKFVPMFAAVAELFECV